MGVIDTIISVAAILGVVVFLVWVFIWDMRAKRALKEIDQWDRALKELYREAEERKRKKEETDDA